jgi:dTMP kinase
MKAGSAEPVVDEAWRQGTVVAICGIDGSGKSTLATSLAQALERLDVKVTLTRQPTDYYRNDRNVRHYHDEGDSPMWEEGLALLSACDRLLHLRTEVIPALNEGGVVISDRFLHATHAIFRARGVDGRWLSVINQYCPPPHICVLLDCPTNVARERIERRGGHIRLEERSSAALEAIRRSYLKIVPADAVVLDATATPEMLLRDVLNAVQPIVLGRATAR